MWRFAIDYSQKAQAVEDQTLKVIFFVHIQRF